MPAKEHALQIFNAAVAAVQPDQLIPQHLYIANGLLYISGHHFEIHHLPNIYVIGAGKASAAMAVSVENILGDFIKSGIVVTKYGHALPLKIIVCKEAAHPVPDEAGIAATDETIQLLKQCRPNDIVICLISGGASSLWIDLPGGASLNDVQYTFKLLIQCGAAIDEINMVRRHLSAIKGGQLLNYAPQARWFSFIISDVPGDNLQAIASGPTVPDNSSFAGVKNILEKYQLTNKLPAAILKHINAGIKGLASETTPEESPAIRRVVNTIIGNNLIALAAAKKKSHELGYHIALVNTSLSGDAAAIATWLIGQASKYTGILPACYLLGGETTVTVTGKGKGGRNQQMALSALLALAAQSETAPFNQLTFLSAGTDGTDGPTDAAGAIADKSVLYNAGQKKLNLKRYLYDNNAYDFFEQAGGLLKTGPTQTNVMDLVIVMIE